MYFPSISHLIKVDFLSINCNDIRLIARPYMYHYISKHSLLFDLVENSLSSVGSFIASKHNLTGVSTYETNQSKLDKQIDGISWLSNVKRQIFHLVYSGRVEGERVLATTRKIWQVGY